MITRGMIFDNRGNHGRSFWSELDRSASEDQLSKRKTGCDLVKHVLWLCFISLKPEYEEVPQSTD